MKTSPSNFEPLTFYSDPSLRPTFSKYLQILKIISGYPELKHTFEGLVSDGCDFMNLLMFLDRCVIRRRAVAFDKRNLDSVKHELDSVIRRSETLRKDIVRLRTTPAGPAPMFRSSVFDTNDVRGEPKLNRNYFFKELPDTLTDATARLKELKQAIAERHSVRNSAPAQTIAFLYLYCCAGTGRQVTYRHMANLLNAGFMASGSQRVISEATVRMALQRLKRSPTALSYGHIEALMEDYVRCCPTGVPFFLDWLPSHVLLDSPACDHCVREPPALKITAGSGHSPNGNAPKNKAVCVLDKSCASAAVCAYVQSRNSHRVL